MNENPQSNIAWEDRLTWFKSSSQYRALDKFDGEPMEFEWNIFPEFTTLQLFNKVQEFLSKMSVEPEDFAGRIIFVSMFNDISWRSRDNEQECESSAKLVWSFLGPGSEKKWYYTHDSKPQGEWDRVAELMMLTFAESGHPVFRVRSPLFRGTLKSRGGGTLSINYCADRERLKLFFAQLFPLISLVFTELSQKCACHDRTGRIVVAGQSNPLSVPSVMKTHRLLTDDLAQEEDLLQRYQERIEKLSK